MSTAKRLVLSLRGRKESQSTAGTSSTRLVSVTGSSPGHELDEIAVVSGSGDSCHALSYGSLTQSNGPTQAYTPSGLFTLVCPLILWQLSIKQIRLCVNYLWRIWIISSEFGVKWRFSFLLFYESTINNPKWEIIM